MHRELEPRAEVRSLRARTGRRAIGRTCGQRRAPRPTGRPRNAGAHARARRRAQPPPPRRAAATSCPRSRCCSFDVTTTKARDASRSRSTTRSPTAQVLVWLTAPAVQARSCSARTACDYLAESRVRREAPRHQRERRRRRDLLGVRRQRRAARRAASAGRLTLASTSGVGARERDGADRHRTSAVVGAARPRSRSRRRRPSSAPSSPAGAGRRASRAARSSSRTPSRRRRCRRRPRSRRRGPWRSRRS